MLSGRFVLPRPQPHPPLSGLTEIDPPAFPQPADLSFLMPGVSLKLNPACTVLLPMLVFIDFKASSLAKRSYPIEVAWVF